MIEIRTQEEFDKLPQLLEKLGESGEYIRIYDLGDNQSYNLAETLKIYKSNTIIEGYGKSKPKINWIGGTDTKFMMEVGTDNLDAHIKTVKNCAIRNLYFIGNSIVSAIISTSGVGAPSGSVPMESKPNLVGFYEPKYTANNVMLSFGVTIEDCHFKNCVNAVFLSFCHNCIVRQNVITNCYTGVQIQFSDGIIIANNNISNAGYNNINVTSNGTPSSYLVCRNVCQGSDSGGIDLSVTGGALVYNNKCFECEYGIKSQLSLFDSLITQNETRKNVKSGIAVNSNCLNVLVSDCTSVENGEDGIHLSRNSGNILLFGNNTVGNSTNGIFSDGCYNVNIVNNTSCNNTKHGIYESQTKQSCLIFSNTSFNNKGSNFLAESLVTKYNNQYN